MKNLLKQYLPYLVGYKKQFFFAVLGMITVTVGTAGTAQLIKPVLDDVFINKNGKIICQGSHNDLLQDCAVYKKLSKHL